MKSRVLLTVEEKHMVCEVCLTRNVTATNPTHDGENGLAPNPAEK